MKLRLYVLFLPLLLLAAGLRIHLLGEALRAQTPLYADEAYFASFARGAALRGEWLLPGTLDKPPLAIYAQVAAMAALARPNPAQLLDLSIAQAEFAARLPGLLAGILLPAAMARAAFALYRDLRLAWAAGALAALSPLALLFSPTAFTDMPMLALATLAVACAASRRAGWAGVWLALAFLCKYQALYFLPLVALIGLGTGWPRAAWGRFLGALVAGGVALVVWDAGRGQAVSLWAMAAANTMPNRLIRASEVQPRLVGWLAYGGALFGTPTGLLLTLGVVSTVRRALSPTRAFTARRVQVVQGALTVERARIARPRTVWFDMLLLAFLLAYLLLHVLAAFNSYDRYLLPLLVPGALLGGRGVLWLYDALDRKLPRGEAGFLPFVIALALLGGSLNVLGGTVPYARAGSSFETRQGMAPLAAWINAQPLGTIVYDHWLGWELDFYLGEWTDKRRVFYPTPDELVSGARAQPDPAPRLFIAPVEQPLALWLTALADAGFTVTTAEDTALPRGFQVFWLLPPAR